MADDHANQGNICSTKVQYGPADLGRGTAPGAASSSLLFGRTLTVRILAFPRPRAGFPKQPPSPPLAGPPFLCPPQILASGAGMAGSAAASAWGQVRPSHESGEGSYLSIWPSKQLLFSEGEVGESQMGGG